MTLSTDEWEMSRSCHRATFSRAARALARTILDRPQRFSHSMGLRLWGMALEPFWPRPKGSATSATSVRWSRRISNATFSTDAAIPASTEKKWACRSR